MYILFKYIFFIIIICYFFFKKKVDELDSKIDTEYWSSFLTRDISSHSVHTLQNYSFGKKDTCFVCCCESETHFHFKIVQKSEFDTFTLGQQIFNRSSEVCH